MDEKSDVTFRISNPKTRCSDALLSFSSQVNFAHFMFKVQIFRLKLGPDPKSDAISEISNSENCCLDTLFNFSSQVFLHILDKKFGFVGRNLGWIIDVC